MYFPPSHPNPTDIDTPFYLEIVREDAVFLFVLTSMVALTCTAPADGDPVLTMTHSGGADPLIIHQGEDADKYYEWVLRAKILHKSFLRIDTRCGKVNFWTQQQINQNKGVL